ncbi:hypothetical protein RAA17_24335 [Komagataeibacter rhaeticus]|nr:hypothetical protein [Komagataeibacter rhaeticus]
MTLTRCAHQALMQTLGNGPNGQDSVWHRAMDAIASGSDTAMMPAQCKSALAVLRALHARTTEARRRLETTSPRLLATALLMANRADPQINESATALMDGIRLFPWAVSITAPPTSTRRLSGNGLMPVPNRS